MDIVKKSGEVEVYDPQKLCASIEAAGTPKVLAQKICIEVEEGLEPGATTKKIYRETVRRLLKEGIELTARYSLRRAIDNLGPTGFLFEQFIEALLQAHGYKTQRNIMMKGECVIHEVDVFAKKGDVNFIIEAKYHNDHNIKTHIDQVMYADARLMDIQRRQKKRGDTGDYVMWVITNTKFSHQAIKYSKCRELKLLGWNYPHDNNLEEMIIHKKMYPITVLPSLTKFARDEFTKHTMILAQDILPYSVESLKKQFSLSESLAKKLLNEAHELIK